MAAIATSSCPKCGTPRGAAAACPKCGLLAEKMATFSSNLDSAVPDVARTAWERVEAQWEETASHDELLRLGIRDRTVAPLALVPLVEVAWADGKMDPREMEAVLAAAASVGLPPASPGYELLESWLEERPAPALRELWANYIHSLCQAMSPEAQRELRDDVLGRARRVAEAAGGVLGFGSRVSSAEAAVLAALAAAFDA